MFKEIYKRLRKNLRNKLYRYNKKHNTHFSAKDVLPKQPKKITQGSINKLEKVSLDRRISRLTTNYDNSKQEYKSIKIDENNYTDDYQNFTEYVENINKDENNYQTKDRIIIAGYRYTVQETPNKIAERLNNQLTKLISEHGEHVVAQAIEKLDVELIQLCIYYDWDSDQIVEGWSSLVEELMEINVGD